MSLPSPVIALLSVLIAASPVAARNIGDAQTVCLSTGYYWRGDNSDIARIRQVPVPESFRRRFEGGGCGRWQLIEETLIEWHLAFGDEATATAALAFLAQDYGGGENAPSRFEAALPRAWRAAGRALAAAGQGS